MSSKSILIWIGGDITQYKHVTYVINGSRYTSFISAAALAEALNPDKLVVLVPETLFEDRHCESYRRLLEAKSGFDGWQLDVCAREGSKSTIVGDELVRKLLRKGFECYVVPHSGIATPLKLDVFHEKKAVRVTRLSPRAFPSYSFNLIFSSIYLVLSNYAREFSEMYIDLTHGTNVMVSATLLASTLLPIVFGTKVRIFVAPVMGRPGEANEVKFLTIDEATNVVREVVAGAQAWSMLDERMLPITYFEELGKKLGPKYKSIYGHLKSILRKSSELLWGLRSGQASVLYDQVKSLDNTVVEAERAFENIVSREYPLSNEAHQSKWVEHGSEPPWPPIVSTALILTKGLVSELRSDRYVDFVLKCIEMLSKRGYPDRALSMAREWMVALTLWSKGFRGELRVGDEAWENAERELTRKHDVFERVRQYRNRLMHGRLSREEAAKLVISDDDVVLEYPRDVISVEDLRKLANELLHEVRKLVGKRLGGDG